MDPFSDFVEGFCIVKFACDCCAEFKRLVPREQKIDALLHSRGIVTWNADGFAVTFQGIFDVYRHIVEKSPFRESSKAFRGSTVGIELDLESHIPDLENKIFNARLQQRFAARNADSVQNALALAEELEEVFDRNVRGLKSVRDHQGRVMAEGTTPVTAPSEHGASEFARKVEES